MGIIFGSARSDERGNLSGGSAGDQTGKEVSTQPMYVHSKGWYIFRAKDISISTKLANGMLIACSNNNIGYDQSNRLGVIKYGVNTKTKTETDCSALVRACCIFAGFDPGNFSTADECKVLEATGKFNKKITYISQSKTPVFDGDILVTKTKGHTGIIVSGNPRIEYVHNGINYISVFDPIWYANKWSDLKEVFGYNVVKLFNHFTSFGMSEGRQACADFNVQFYKSNNPDLVNAFGPNLKLYYKHFCEFGKKEGRRGV